MHMFIRIFLFENVSFTTSFSRYYSTIHYRLKLVISLSINYNIVKLKIRHDKLAPEALHEFGAPLSQLGSC